MFACLKKLFKPKYDTFPQKVEYLLTKDLNLYKYPMATSTQDFVEKDIHTYIHVLSRIASSNYTTEYISIKNITNYTLHHTTYAKWISGTDYISQTSNDDLKRWLTVSLEVYHIYMLGKLDPVNAYLNGNSRKIQPYIINIENILNDILKVFL